MGKVPAYQWYPGDWTKDPAVRALSPEAKAFWREAIDVLFESSTRGKFTTTMEGWATATGSPPLWIEMFLSENDCLKVADVTICNSHVTLMSRRMMREEKAREQGRKRVAKHRSKADVTEESEIVTPPSSSSSSSSSSKEGTDTRLQMLFQTWEQKITLVPSSDVLPALRTLLEWLENQIAFKGIDDWLPPEEILSLEILALADKLPDKQNIKYFQGMVQGKLRDKLEGK